MAVVVAIPAVDPKKVAEGDKEVEDSLELVHKVVMKVILAGDLKVVPVFLVVM